MPRTSKAEAPVGVDEDVIEGRYVELDDLTVGFETHKADVDPAPLFAGLPDDRCQCRHIGYVRSGKVVFRFADHDETYSAGDAYVAGPGHVPLMFAGTELVEFTPTDELNATMSVVGANLAASRTASTVGG
ncbi:MAG: cupin domain-containing protein [Mycobacteriales bacterium]